MDHVPSVAARVAPPSYLVAFIRNHRFYAPFACWEIGDALLAAAALARDLGVVVSVYAWELGELLVSVAPGPSACPTCHGQWSGVSIVA